MTRDDTIRLAREAGAIPSGDPQEWDVWLFQDPAMERFAALVAAEKDKEIAELKHERRRDMAEICSLREAEESLREENERLRADAERYRWLRENRYMKKFPNSEFNEAMHLSFTVSDVWSNNNDPAVLDALIDSTIKKAALRREETP